MAKPHRRKGFMAQQGTLVDAPGVALALGEMAARWSFLEYELMMVLRHLTGQSHENATAIMYAVNATSARLDIVRAAAERLPESDTRRQLAIAAVEQCVTLCQRRNALTHHFWVTDPKGKAHTFDFRYPADTQGRRVSRSAESILKYCDEIADAYQPLCAAEGGPIEDGYLTEFKTSTTRLRAIISALG
jgi:hypothetical protein